MNKTKLIISLSIIPLVLLSSCSSKNFTNWKKEGSIKAIKEFIDDVCDKNSKN